LSYPRRVEKEITDEEKILDREKITEKKR